LLQVAAKCLRRQFPRARRFASDQSRALGVPRLNCSARRFPFPHSPFLPPPKVVAIAVTAVSVIRHPAKTELGRAFPLRKATRKIAGRRTRIPKCSKPLRWPGQGKFGSFSRRAGIAGHGGGNNRVMEFQDKLLKCVDCGKDFVFTAGEQLFFHDKQRGGGSSVRAETRTHCSVCGQETTVPFRPTQGRPVLCRSCFEQNRRTSGTQSVVAAMAQTETGAPVDSTPAEVKSAG